MNEYQATYEVRDTGQQITIVFSATSGEENLFRIIDEAKLAVAQNEMQHARVYRLLDVRSAMAKP